MPTYCALIASLDLPVFVVLRLCCVWLGAVRSLSCVVLFGESLEYGCALRIVAYSWRLGFIRGIGAWELSGRDGAVMR